MKTIKKFFIYSILFLFTTQLKAQKEFTFKFGNNKTKTIKESDYQKLFPRATAQANDTPIKVTIPMENKKVTIYHYKRGSKKLIVYCSGLSGNLEGAKKRARTLFKNHDVVIIRYGWQDQNDRVGSALSIPWFFFKNTLCNPTNPKKASENFFNNSINEIKTVVDYFKKQNEYDEYVGFFNSYGNYPGLSNQGFFDKIISAACWHNAKEASKNLSLVTKLASPFLISDDISTETLFNHVQPKGDILMLYGIHDELTPPESFETLYQAINKETQKNAVITPGGHRLDFYQLSTIINLFIDAKDSNEFRTTLLQQIVS